MILGYRFDSADDAIVRFGDGTGDGNCDRIGVKLSVGSMKGIVMLT